MKYFLLSLAALLLLLSCDSSTSPSEDSFTISGKVSLLDSEGNPVTEGLEDIIVMIYNTIEIDPDLLQVKADYPHIGAEINQEVFFDIRDEEPIKTVSCDSEGNYSFSIPKGNYNLCFYGENYGYKLIHELEVTSDQALSEAVLYEVISLSGSISDFTFESDKVYYITDDLIIPANSNVLFETGTNVDVADNKKIFFIGDFNIIENQYDTYIKFNSFYNTTRSKNIFRGIEFINISNLTVEKCIIKNAVTGIGLSSILSSVDINNCILFNNSIGVSTQQVSSITVSNCNIYNNYNLGIDLTCKNYCYNNIVFNNNEGMRITEADSENFNNYYLSNFMGLRVAYFNIINVYNNEFNFNDYGVSMSGANPNIYRNNFKDDNVNIEICRRYVQDYYDFSLPVITFNNFTGNGYLLDLKGIHSISSAWFEYWGVDDDLICNDNFWNNNKEMIKDGFFYGMNYYLVIIERELFSVISNNGIE